MKKLIFWWRDELKLANYDFWVNYSFNILFASVILILICLLFYSVVLLGLPKSYYKNMTREF